MLKVSNLWAGYDEVSVLHDVTLEVHPGEVVALVGANGAGKSTMMRCLAGLLKPTGGSIQFLGEEIGGLPAAQVVARGLAYVPEGRRLFGKLSVRENLLLGAYIRNDAAEVENDLEWVYTLFPRMRERSWQKGGTLSGGEQQMLALGRALMSRPDLVMLDEPSLGLAPLLVKEVFDIIRTVNERGKTVLLVEQNAYAALKVAHYAYVLEVGNIVLQGTGEELIADPRVREAYLGG